jgi:major vault protein
MIQYDGKYMHHAIAIPEGEGRYILNRLTGKVETIKGPQMYLPDPRTEVVVKRKLSPKECELFYPDNYEVVAYNEGLNEKAMEKLARKGGSRAITDAINAAYSTANQEATLAIFETGSNVSRGVSYTKPRTITLDTKFDGVVGIDVWTGYAVNVISKTGKREVVVGPGSRLLNYDETLEAMELSTGTPKTSDRVLSTAFLRVENNRISDIISAQTKDFVEVQIKVSYCVDFLPEHKDKWFSVENYVQHLCDRQRSLIKREVKKYNIEDFYANATDIIRGVALDKHICTCENSEESCDCETPQHKGRFFPENGMLVSDTEVLSVSVERSVASILEQHQGTMIAKGLELSDAEKAMKVEKQLAAYEKEKIELAHKNELYKMELDKARTLERLATEAKIEEESRAAEEARVQAKADMQELLDAIHTAELERNKLADAAAIETEQKLAAVEKAKQAAYAETVKTIMESVDESLVAALTANANADMLAAVTQSIAPYAMAKGETVADFTNTLLRGTTLEGVVDNLTKVKIED